MTEAEEDLFNKSTSTNKQTNNTKHLLNKLLNKERFNISVSFTREEFNKLAIFLEIAKRERKTFAEKKGQSAAVKRAMWEYVEHHPVPNPQVTLERGFNLGMPTKPSDVCCVNDCRAKAVFLLTLKDFNGKTETFNVCYRHKRWKHERFRYLASFKPIRK